MFRYAFLITTTLLLTGQAGAQTISQYYSTSMSCDQVRATIQAEGIVLMRYRSQNNPNLERYDRYVANGHLCPVGLIVDKTHIPASDTAYCPVKHCRPKTFLDRNQQRF